MRWTWAPFLLLPLLACGGGTSDGEIPVVLPLQLLVPAADPAPRVVPALLEPLDDAVATFSEATGREVVVLRLDPSAYEAALRRHLHGQPHPDLLWVRAPELAYLVSADWLVPLEDQIAADPDVLAGTQPWMQELYDTAGHRYGVPVGEQAHHPLTGYAITMAAAERGHVGAAFDLLRHLRERIPLRGRCDVALDELRITVEDAGGGDVIEENHYLDGLVRNLGDVPAENVHVLVEADGLGVLDEVTIPWIESRGESTLRLELEAAEPGLYTLTTRVDMGHQLAELNEINNQDHLAWEYKYAGGTGPTVVKPQGAAFTIATAAYTSNVTGMNPKVASDGTNYLVVYAKQTPLAKEKYNHHLRATRISSTGTVLDPGGFVVASQVGKYNNFSVAYGGGQYLVAWEYDTFAFPLPDPISRIQAARISTSGSLMDSSPITVEESPDSSYTSMLHEYPGVYWDGTHFVVVYRDVPYFFDDPATVGPYGIFAKRVSASGQVQTGRAQLQPFTSTYRGGGVQHVAFAAGQGLVIYEGGTSTVKGIHGRHFTSSGGDPVPSTTPYVVFFQTTDLKAWIDWPCVAHASASHYLGVWARRLSTGSGTYFQVDLATVGGPGSAVTQRGPLATKAGDRFPAVAHDGKAYTLVTEHHLGCHSYVGAVRVSHTGVWSPPVVFAGHDQVADVDVAYAATNGLIVYENLKPPSTFNGSNYSLGVYARLIDQSQ